MRNDPWLLEVERALRRATPEVGPDARGRRDCLRAAAALEPLSLDQAVSLLAAPAGADEDLFAAARQARAAVFGARVGLFAPLYYSNVCVNDCLYCGFRRSLGAQGRRTLTPGEVAAEAAALRDAGHRSILLIASEDPTAAGLDLALRAVEAARRGAEACDAVSRPDPARAGSPGGLRWSIEMAPRPAADMARLRAAGITGYVLFQETYDARIYPALHPSGPKSDFAKRLLGPESAARGGIPHLGLGTLYGLGDPVHDTVAMIAHARRLERILGRAVASVSVPRLEPAEGVPLSVSPPHPVSDRLWLRIVAVLRLALPMSDVIVSTRETAGLRRDSLLAGASVFSAGSRTDPGGYREPGGALGQFAVGDGRALREVAEDLERMGYRPQAAYLAAAEMRGPAAGEDAEKPTAPRARAG